MRGTPSASRRSRSIRAGRAGRRGPRLHALSACSPLEQCASVDLGERDRGPDPRRDPRELDQLPDQLHLPVATLRHLRHELFGDPRCDGEQLHARCRRRRPYDPRPRDCEQREAEHGSSDLGSHGRGAARCCAAHEPIERQHPIELDRSLPSRRRDSSRRGCEGTGAVAHGADRLRRARPRSSPSGSGSPEAYPPSAGRSARRCAASSPSAPRRENHRREQARAISHKPHDRGLVAPAGARPRGSRGSRR